MNKPTEIVFREPQITGGEIRGLEVYSGYINIYIAECVDAGAREKSLSAELSAVYTHATTLSQGKITTAASAVKGTVAVSGDAFLLYSVFTSELFEL